MALRSTEHFVEYVFAQVDSSPVRLTEAFVEIIVSQIPNSPVRLTETFLEYVVAEPSFAEDTCNLTDAASLEDDDFDRNAVDFIGLTDEATSCLEATAASADTIVCADVSIGGGGDTFLFATDLIGCTDEVTVSGGSRFIDASDTINCQETLTVAGGTVDIIASDSINCQETLDIAGGDRFADTSDTINCQETVEVSGGSRFADASDTINCQETLTVAGGSRFINASDTINCTETDETAGGSRFFFATDTINCDETIVDGGDVRLSIAESCVPTETLIGGGDVQHVASDTIGVSEKLQEFECITDTLTCSDEVVIPPEMGVDILILSETASVLHEITGTASDTITCTDTSSMFIEFCTFATDELETFDTDVDIDQSPPVFVTTQTSFFDEVFAGGDQTVSASDSISIFEAANGWVIPAVGIDAAAEDTIGCTDESRFSVEDKAVDSIGFVDSADAIICRPAADILDLTDSADSCVVYCSTTASDDIDLNEFMLVVTDPRTSDCEYDDQLGPYPADSGLDFQLDGVGNWAVRAPNLGNTDSFSPQRIVSESRGGTLLISADPNWPKVETLSMAFSALKYSEVLALQDFIFNNLGTVITLTDWEGRQWTGIISDPTATVREVSKNNFSIGFTFEGEKI